MDSSLVRTCPGIGRPCDRTVPHNPHDTRTISDRGIRRTLAIGHSTGMVELFHTPVGPRRHDAHAPNRQQAKSQKDGDDDDHAHRFLIAQDRRFSYAVLSTRTPSDTVTGVIVRACGVWGRFFFRFRTSLDGRHKDRKIWGYERAKGGKNGRNRFGKPLYGFPSSCSGRL
jgi:hypothetical protein